MNLRLELTNARETGHPNAHTLDFDSGPVTIGRSSQSRVVIEGDMISRTHLVLDVVHDTWQVTHHGKLTPTLLNGTPIPHGQPRRVNDGDVITVGDYTIRASYGRETMLPHLEPMRDSMADMTMDRANVMTQVADGQRGQRASSPGFAAAPGPAGRVVPSLLGTGEETSKLELREVERAYVIGRAAGCDLVLQNGSVSRRHAIVRFDGNRIYVRDAGARNPLRVNGRSIFGESPLAHGDILGVGPVELRVVTEAEAPHAAPAASPPGAQTQVYQGGRETGFPHVESPSPVPDAGSMPVEPAPRWDQVASRAPGPDWAAAAAPPARAAGPLPPPPPPPAPNADWSAMAAAPARAPAAPRAWEVPAGPAAPPPPAPPAWDVPPAPPPMAPPPPAPAWSPPPPVGAPPPPPPPPPMQFAAPPPPAIPQAAPAAGAERAPAAGLGAAPKVVARRASSHKGWLVAGVVCMLVALTAGIVLLVAAGSRS